MYREPLATNKPKQKSTTSPPDPLGPARSAVQRRRPGRLSNYAFRPELGRSITIEEGRRSESFRAQRSNAASSRSDGLSDGETLSPLFGTTGNEWPSFQENIEPEYPDSQSERLTQMRDMASMLDFDPDLPMNDSRPTSLRHISTSPPISSYVAGGLPAILDRARERSTPIRGDARERLRRIFRRARRDYRRRGLTQEEVDGLGDRRRSPTPEDDSWDILRTTITPDERLPSLHSSFTSTEALSISDSTRSAAVSLPTNEGCAFCAALDINTFTEESGPEGESDTS